MQAREAYLQTQVMTASPHKLRLMLIEGAIRFTLQTRQLWEENRLDDALEASIRAREIVCELMASLSRESPLTAQIMPLYVFIFRSLTEAQLERDAAKLEGALRVLNEERETWQQVCAKFADSDERPAAVEVTSASPALPSAPPPPHRAPAFPPAAPRGVSFEA